MSARMARTALAGAAVLIMVAATSAAASDVTLPQDLTSGGVKWQEFDNQDELSGCTSLDHQIASGTYLPGYAPEEAVDNSASDGFDDYAMVTVDGQYFSNPGTMVDLTGQALTTRTVDFGGVQVTIQHMALTNQPILRTFVTLQNTTAVAATKTVTVEQDLGSDDGTWVQTTSSGDDTWATADRWAITTQGNVFPVGDPVITTVLFGPGTVASPQTNLYLCGDRWTLPSAGTAQAVKDDAVNADALANLPAQTSASYFSVTIPAGETRSLAFFSAVTPNTAVAPAEELTALYDAGLTGPLAEGLTTDQVRQTVNWSPPIEKAADVVEATPVQVTPRLTG